jgi:hypothetical protein
MASLDWLEPWEPVAPEHAPAIEAELKRELTPGHVPDGCTSELPVVAS